MVSHLPIWTPPFVNTAAFFGQIKYLHFLRTSPSRKNKATTRNKENYKMKKLTTKGKHLIKVGNHPHINMTSKIAIMRGGQSKCRIFERHLKWRDQTLLFLNFKYQGIKMKVIKLLRKETKSWLRENCSLLWKGSCHPSV